MNERTNIFTDIYTEELVENPSQITRHILEIIIRLNDKHMKEFSSRNILKKFYNDVKTNLYINNNYYIFYQLLHNYVIPAFNSHNTNKKIKIELLFEEFEKLYTKLIFNNYALAYLYLNQKIISNVIFTMEDKKNLFLKKLYNKEITIGQFNKAFGHYTLNAYELSSKRFEEYNPQELLFIAKFASYLNIKSKKTLDEFIATKPKNNISILIALREFAKYKILFIVRDIRYELLKIAQEKSISNIFDVSFEDIINLHRRQKL